MYILFMVGNSRVPVYMCLNCVNSSSKHVQESDEGTVWTLSTHHSSVSLRLGAWPLGLSAGEPFSALGRAGCRSVLCRLLASSGGAETAVLWEECCVTAAAPRRPGGSAALAVPPVPWGWRLSGLPDPILALSLGENETSLALMLLRSFTEVPGQVRK